MKRIIVLILATLGLTLGMATAASAAPAAKPFVSTISLQACRTERVDPFGNPVVQVRMWLVPNGNGLDVYVPGSAVLLDAHGAMTVSGLADGRTITVEVTVRSWDGVTVQHRVLWISRNFCRAYGPFVNSRFA